jgi:restriction system protein
VIGPPAKRLGLVSFPVFFQCKRYQGSVRPGAVRGYSSDTISASEPRRALSKMSPSIDAAFFTEI